MFLAMSRTYAGSVEEIKSRLRVMLTKGQVSGRAYESEFLFQLAKLMESEKEKEVLQASPSELKRKR